MTTTETTTALATVKTVDLHRVLFNAAIFAGRDVTLPMVNLVHVEFTGTRILAVATDRFRMGVAKLDLPEGGGGATTEFNVSLTDVNTLIKWSKTLKRDEDSRYVWINQNSDGTIRFNFDTTVTLTVTLDVKPVDHEFPKWRGLFPKTPGYPRFATGFTAEFLASFAKVNAGPTGTIVLYSHDDIHGYRDKPEKSEKGKPRGCQKPLTFTIGDNFVGLLMPVKITDEVKHEWHLPEWVG